MTFRANQKDLEIVSAAISQELGEDLTIEKHAPGGGKAYYKLSRGGFVLVRGTGIKDFYNRLHAFKEGIYQYKAMLEKNN